MTVVFLSSLVILREVVVIHAAFRSKPLDCSDCASLRAEWRGGHWVSLRALIAYLLLALYAQARAVMGSLWMALAQVRATLFQRPTLEAIVYRRREQQLAEFAAIQPKLF